VAGMTGSAGQSRIHRNEVYAELRNPANYRPMPKQQTDYQNTRGRLPEAFDRGAVLRGQFDKHDGNDPYTDADVLTAELLKIAGRLG